MTEPTWKTMTWHTYDSLRKQAGKDAPHVCQYGDCREAAIFLMQSDLHHTETCPWHTQELTLSHGYAMIGEN